ncbi:MAG: lysylphosphatidylglycerol synthase transmembrane domain-containing protein [Coleofasciculus sp. A1-SPW-01]|nr:lysylphosphatidylglycerol synthase transmembrane domain-containing protein [Coleofasciculus chthonoplastes]
MKKIISFAVSLIILGILYWKTDVSQLMTVLQNCDWLWLTLSMSLIAPITILNAWRLQQLIPMPYQMKFGQVYQLILIANSLNMVLPSKMGDVAKAYFIKEQGHIDGCLSLCLIIFEKLCDMLSVLICCGFGLFFYDTKSQVLEGVSIFIFLAILGGFVILFSAELMPTIDRTLKINYPRLHQKSKNLIKSWRTLNHYIWHNKIIFGKIILTSLIISFLNFLQIWLLIIALNAWTPFLISLALTPLAILAGLLPFTFAGIGTRDAAFIMLYQPFFNTPTGAALGLLCTSRYLLPAIMGLPFLGRSLSFIQQKPHYQKEL